MAVPKRRTSKMRSKTRNSHSAYKHKPLQACPRCGQPRKLHAVCGHCGYYKGQDVLKLEE